MDRLPARTYNAAGMRPLLTFALAGALLVSAAAPASVRYNCKMTGARNQLGCCCKGASSKAATAGDCTACPSMTGPTDSCGCCDTTVADDRPAGIATDFTADPVQEVFAWVDGLPVSMSAALPSHHLGTHAAGIRAPGDDPPEPFAVGQRALLCTFLC